MGTIRLTVPAALALALAAAPIAHAKKKPPTVPISVALPDETVSTPLGNFTFSHLTLGQKVILGTVVPSSSLQFNGTATNATDHTWKRIFFSAIFTDAAGTVVQNDQLSYTLIGAGQSQKLGILDDGDPVSFSSPPAKLTIKYLLGELLNIDYRLRMTKPADSEGMAFEDASLQATFGVTRQAVQFTILNKTNGPVKIDWNQVSFIDGESNSHPVTHQGVKYTDAAATKPPSVIPPSAKFSDTIVPANNVHFSSGEYGGWSTTDILTGTPLATTLKGKTISVYMPLELNGTQRNYLFSFEITDVLLK
jgi:hypothetical protein